ncbi:hypothetical protein I4U23_021460 [Adineta vaga]|nr:hypothetical protein I4U23_021460 [Adineta vaga]
MNDDPAVLAKLKPKIFNVQTDLATKDLHLLNSSSLDNFFITTFVCINKSQMQHKQNLA